MKTSYTLKILTLFAIFIAFNASSYAEKKVVYKGDKSARHICTAIVKDDIKKLKRALRPRSVGVINNKSHLHFNCNGEDLFNFAKSVNSSRSAYFLARKFGKKDYLVKHAGDAKKEKDCEKEKSTQQG